jgi:hypothetical protein
LFQKHFVDAEAQNFLPWVTACIGIFIWLHRQRIAEEKYEEFVRNSPGKEVDTSGIEYGVGHPAYKDKK